MHRCPLSADRPDWLAIEHQLLGVRVGRVREKVITRVLRPCYGKLGPSGGLGFADEFHPSWTLAANLRPHDRLVHVPCRGERFLPLRQQFPPLCTLRCFLPGSLGPDFASGGLRRTTTPENESGAIQRWGATDGNAGVDSDLFALLSRYSCDL